MNRLIFFLFLSLFTSGLFAQVMGNSQYNQYFSSNPNDCSVSNAVIVENDEILIQSSGLMNIVGDNYVAVFNIAQVGELLEDVDQIMSDRINVFKKELKCNGIAEENIKTDLISFLPRYDVNTETKLFSKSYNEVPSGYEMQKNISVLYKKTSQLDGIMSSALKSEIYDIVKVDFFISDINQLRDSLRNLCLEDIKNKINLYAQLGVKLDTLNKNISDGFVTIYPQTKYVQYQAFARPSLGVAKKKQTFNEVPKTITRFYSPQNSGSYDVVVNPVITEPVVQLSYTVVIKYIRDLKKDSQLKVLTSTGEIKQLLLK